MDKPLTVYAEIDDPELAAEFKATLEREGRTQKKVVEFALRDYIAKSKAEAAPTKADTRRAKASA